MSFISQFKHRLTGSIGQFVVFFVLSVIICCFHFSTTPFFSGSAYDAGVFRVIAKAWLDGQIPYKDIFDHKGPLLYIIYMVDYILPVPKWGLLILSAIFSSLCCLIAGKMVDVYGLLNLKERFLIQICFWLWIMHYERDGFLTETWSLLFLMIPVLFTLKWLRNEMKESYLNLSNCLMLGVCFGVHAMIRLSNGMTIAGIVLIIIVALAYQKHWKKLLVALCYMGLGVGIIVLPFIIYFTLKDAVYDLYYSNFEFNTAYAAYARKLYLHKRGILSLLVSPERLGIVLLFTVAAYYLLRAKLIDLKKEFIPLVFLAFCSTPFLLTGLDNGLLHYHLLLAPFIPIILIFAFILAKQQTFWKKVIILNMIFIYMLWPIKTHILAIRDINHTIKAGKETDLDTVATWNIIPHNEHDEVWSMYGFQTHFFTVLGNVPVNKFWYGPMLLSQVHTPLFHEWYDIFQTAAPKWVITSSLPKNPTGDEKRFLENFLSRYQLVRSGKNGLLYRVKEKN